MFKPRYDVCTGTDKHKGCGKKGLITTNSRKLCQTCESERKPKAELNRAPIKKVTPKQKVKIRENKYFYAIFIDNHTTKCCDECNEPIHKPTGSNVSHIVSGGSNPALYMDERNAFLLCQKDENQWSNVDPTVMKIWPEAQRRKTELLNEHYVKPITKKK